MDLEDRIEIFARLGEILLDAVTGKPGMYSDRLNLLIESQHLQNEWFTPENVRKGIKAVATGLNRDTLVKWTSSYPELKEKRNPVRVGVIMAGNIPLVGFYDFLSVLISGNYLIAKTSSKDSELIPCISEILFGLKPEFREKVEFTDGTLSNFDVVIATGSNNSSRYFEYYFNKYPHIIRKNRTSVAVIIGDESVMELKGLANDVFLYFGLGCRNVSKLFLPNGYDVKTLIDNWSDYSNMIHHRKYANNYDFNKAVYIVNKENFTDAGFLLLKEDKSLLSPVAVLHYEYYDSLENARRIIDMQKNDIQCIIGREGIPFGHAQSPHPWDYSDGIDTIEFLLKKKSSGIC
jgi:hypothetical protein